MCEIYFYDYQKDNIKINLTKYENFLTVEYPWYSTLSSEVDLQIHVPRFKEQHFHPIDNGRVYTQYNLKTLTTRPSNKFKGVNYAALNKENGCRKAFLPTNDKFL